MGESLEEFKNSFNCGTRNVVFPLDRLRELQAEGRFRELADHAYSFVGATTQTRLLKESGPEWVERFKRDRLDAALLVPA